MTVVETIEVWDERLDLLRFSFRISYSDYAESRVANHFLNFASEIIGLNDPPFCKPTGAGGIISIFVNKILRLFILYGVFSNMLPNTLILK